MKKRKKVAVVDLLFKYPPDGGARLDVFELLKFLASRYDVRLFFPKMEDDFERGKIDFRIFPEKLKSYLFPIKLTQAEFVKGDFITEVQEALKDFAPDKVIIGDGWHYKPILMEALSSYAPIVRFYAYEGLCLKGHGHRYRNDTICTYCYLNKNSSFQYCVECFKEWQSKKKTKVFDLDIKAAGLPDNSDYPNILRKALFSAQAIIVYNKFYANMLKPFVKKVVICPGGCNTIAYSNKKNLSSQDKFFLMMARCDDYLKGLSILIKAVELLSKKRTDYKVLVTHKDKSLKLPSLMENLGWLSPKELKRYIVKAIATIHPSLWPEPFGIAALESIAAGTPVIASDVGGLGDLVRTTKYGWLFPSGDYEKLADVMSSVLDATPNSFPRIDCMLDKYLWTNLFNKYYIPLLEA